MCQKCVNKIEALCVLVMLNSLWVIKFAYSALNNSPNVKIALMMIYDDKNVLHRANLLINLSYHPSSSLTFPDSFYFFYSLSIH